MIALYGLFLIAVVDSGIILLGNCQTFNIRVSVIVYACFWRDNDGYSKLLTKLKQLKLICSPQTGEFESYTILNKNISAMAFYNNLSTIIGCDSFNFH